MKIVPTGEHRVFQVQFASPQSKISIRNRPKSEKKLLTCCKKTPRKGLHKTISTGLITYKGGLSMEEDPYSIIYSPKKERITYKVMSTSRQLGIAKSITSSPSKTSAIEPIMKKPKRYIKFFEQMTLPKGIRPKQLNKRN